MYFSILLYNVKCQFITTISNSFLSVGSFSGFGVSPWYVKGQNNTVIGYYNRPPFLQEFIEKDVWYHYVFVVDETGGKIYVNGNLIDSQEWDGLPTQVSSSFLWKIGGNYEPGTPEQFFNGKIDDISVWKRALNAYEVKKLFSND